MARGRHEPTPKGLFLWHKEDGHSGQASLISPHWGVWRGVWGFMDPISHTQIHACPPCIPHKSQPLCKIPAGKKIIIKKKKKTGVGSCLAVSRGGCQVEARECQFLKCSSVSMGHAIWPSRVGPWSCIPGPLRAQWCHWRRCGSPRACSEAGPRSEVPPDGRGAGQGQGLGLGPQPQSSWKALAREDGRRAVGKGSWAGARQGPR